MHPKVWLKILVLLLLIGSILTFYALGGTEYLNLASIKQQQAWLSEAFNDNSLLFALVFFLAYVVCTAFSLPIAALLTLLAGAIFGFLHGLILVSFASTIGATLAFLMSRFVFKETIQGKYSEALSKINRGFEQEGNFYLFALRLVPVFPFFMINLTMGLMPIKASAYYWVSQLGMLPGTAVYVFAGTELGKIQALSDITSPGLLLAFALLGVFPIFAKKALAWYRKHYGQV